MIATNPSATRPDQSASLPDELRDGLLQDLLAVGLLLRHLEESAPGADARGSLGTAIATIDADVRSVRAIIDRLRADAVEAAA